MANTSLTILSREIHGDLSRFALESMTNRFGGVTWFILDAERQDDLGLRLCVGQSDSEAEIRQRLAVVLAKA